MAFLDQAGVLLTNSFPCGRTTGVGLGTEDLLRIGLPLVELTAMAQTDSFDDVIGRLRDGDQAAAAEIFNRFAGRLILLARAHLDRRLRRKMDPEDVLQSVFRSFFVRQREGRFELGDWESLWSLLVRITLRKCGRRVAAFHAACRDVDREQSSNVCAEESRKRWEALAREPTPEESATLSETLEYLLKQLDPRRRQILELRLQGYTVWEISSEVGCTQRSVYRALERIRRALCRLEREIGGR